jgi:hypothetical protein
LPRTPRKKAAGTKRPGAQKARADGAFRAKIRMYRQGLGDCFLISLPRKRSRPYYVMIDCGVILGTADPSTIMTKIVDNILSTTGGEIDLLVATHEHWDHLSGFIQAQNSFDKLKVHEVWLGWTENIKDPLTKKLKDEKNRALAALRLGLSRLQLAGATAEDDAAEIGGILEFFGAANGASTGDALDYVRNKTANPRYCLPSDAPMRLDGTDISVYVLGPPHDQQKLRKINPSTRDKETYGLAMEGLELFMDGAATALGIEDEGRPFDQQYEIPFPFAAGMDFFKQQYWKADAQYDWRRIDTDWLQGSSEMALQLDSLTNNTSLVLAIELADGDVLLFAADAQVGNWLSWQELEWTVEGKRVTGPDLLRRTIFYKVGHHGSHNATLKDKGLELMERLRVAMIPVDQEMAKKKRWGKMPLDELVAALDQRTKSRHGVVLRVDRPMPVSQENVVEDPLFFEVTF